ncbi:hypothetical protein KM043_006416 [Ampulex compressa]|nr:hypothetical protein KM043_006416 [Ampulex compressa]
MAKKLEEERSGEAILTGTPAEFADTSAARRIDGSTSEDDPGYLLRKGRSPPQTGVPGLWERDDGVVVPGAQWNGVDATPRSTDLSDTLERSRTILGQPELSLLFLGSKIPDLARPVAEGRA